MEARKTNSKTMAVWAVLLISVFIVFSYGHTINYPFQFDDNIGITTNPAIRNISDISGIWRVYAPRFLAYLTFAFNYSLHGLHPAGFRVFNIAVHALASAAVFFLILMTLSSPRIKHKLDERQKCASAFLAALVFAAHPVQTQAVTYIYQRFASMAALLYLLSILFYARASLSEKFSRRFYLLSLMSFLFAVFTKETAVTLPAAIILYDVVFLKTGRKKLVKRIIPFLVILLAGLWAIFLSGTVPEVSHLEASMSGGRSPMPPPAHYLFTQFRVVVTYLRMVLFPVSQNLDYDYPLYTTILRPETALSLLFHIALISSAAVLLKKNALISFGVFFFYLSLLPESSVIPLGALELELIFEHRLYLPMVGFALFLAGIMVSAGKRALPAAAVFLAAAAVTLSFLTYSRNLVWSSEYALWKDAALKSPAKARPLINLGNALLDMGRFEEARDNLMRAVELEEDNAPALTNIGLSYLEEGNFEKALHYYEKSLVFAPESSFTLYNIGNVYKKLGEFEKAVRFYSDAIAADPRNTGAHNNRGVILAHLGDYSAALDDFTRAVSIDPDYAPAYINRAGIFMKMGDRQRTLEDLNRARELGIVIQGEPGK